MFGVLSNFVLLLECVVTGFALDEHLNRGEYSAHARTFIQKFLTWSRGEECLVEAGRDRVFFLPVSGTRVR